MSLNLRKVLKQSTKRAHNKKTRLTIHLLPSILWSTKCPLRFHFFLKNLRMTSYSCWFYLGDIQSQRRWIHTEDQHTSSHSRSWSLEMAFCSKDDLNTNQFKIPAASFSAELLINRLINAWCVEQCLWKWLTLGASAGGVWLPLRRLSFSVLFPFSVWFAGMVWLVGSDPDSCIWTSMTWEGRWEQIKTTGWSRTWQWNTGKRQTECCFLDVLGKAFT